jgi:NTE family protein
MLFHTGALWRLNELGELGELKRVSSVSGGSIVAGVLALAWDDLAFHDGTSGRFEELVVAPVRRLASKTLDGWAIGKGIFLFGDAAAHVRKDLDRHLYHGATLQDLPPDPPRFIFNATNLSSGALWRFSRPYLWDHKVGKIPEPQLRVATAVAASAAFPPFLSPLELKFADGDFEPQSGGGLQHPPYTTHVELSDGGVYDNLGLETVFKNYETVLVSDGGGQFKPDEDPPNDWARHLLRVLQVMDNQVRSLRKRQLIAAYKARHRLGAYWGIGTNIANFKPTPRGLLLAPHQATIALAHEPTRLAAMAEERQEQLINWGYAACDAALRTHVLPDAKPPSDFPYPGPGVGPIRDL